MFSAECRSLKQAWQSLVEGLGRLSTATQPRGADSRSLHVIFGMLIATCTSSLCETMPRIDGNHGYARSGRWRWRMGRGSQSRVSGPCPRNPRLEETTAADLPHGSM